MASLLSKGKFGREKQCEKLMQLPKIEMNAESEERLNTSMVAVFDSPNFLHDDFFLVIVR